MDIVIWLRSLGLGQYENRKELARSTTLSDISLQCNDLSLSGQSKLSRLVYPGRVFKLKPGTEPIRALRGCAFISA